MINSKIKIISTIVSIGLLIILFATLNYKNASTSYLNIDGLDIDSLDDYPPSIQMYHLIEKYSSEYDVPKWVVYNISYRETRYLGPFHWCYNPYQVSKSGALGPMQIMPTTSRSINGELPKTKLKLDLEYNISTSVKLLRKLYEKWGDWETVCGFYNTGKPIINEYARYCANFRDYEKKLSEIKFDYSQQKVSSKEFTMTFSFNFYKIEFLIDNSKVLELAEIPTIIQKI